VEAHAEKRVQLAVASSLVGVDKAVAGAVERRVVLVSYAVVEVATARGCVHTHLNQYLNQYACKVSHFLVGRESNETEKQSLSPLLILFAHASCERRLETISHRKRKVKTTALLVNAYPLFRRKSSNRSRHFEAAVLQGPVG
jgi:hypothetical protein